MEITTQMIVIIFNIIFRLLVLTVDLAIGRPPLLMGLIQIVDFKSGLGIRPTVLYKRVFLAGFK
jgi:hypothetical protein